MDLRYVPAHHPLCSCELCMLHERTKDLGRGAESATRRQALAWMNTHGKIIRDPRARRDDRPQGEAAPSMGNFTGNRVRFEWNGMPDRSAGPIADAWCTANEAQCLAAERGALLLKLADIPARWWPVRAFTWIEGA